jgi:hypothetical protein
MDASEGTPAVRSRGRLIAFRVLAVLFGLGALGGLFGAGLIVGWFDTTEGGLVAILGGLVFIAAAEWEARQPRVTQ